MQMTLEAEKIHYKTPKKAAKTKRTRMLQQTADSISCMMLLIVYSLCNAPISRGG